MYICILEYIVYNRIDIYIYTYSISLENPAKYKALEILHGFWSKGCKDESETQAGNLTTKFHISSVSIFTAASRHFFYSQLATA